MHAGFRPRFAIYQNAGNTYWTRNARSISPRLVRFGVPSATAWRLVRRRAVVYRRRHYRHRRHLRGLLALFVQLSGARARAVAGFGGHARRLPRAHVSDLQKSGLTGGVVKRTK